MSNESDKPLRLALIGLGGVNRWLFRPAIQQCPVVQLIAGVSPTASSRQDFAENWPINVYERFDQMMSQEKLDGVVIGSPTHLHLDHIREAAEAGLHVMVTKPLCNTVAECRDAIAATTRAGVVLHVAHEFRYRPPIRRMIELARQVDAGPLGTATILTMHMGHAGGLKDVAADSWRMNPQNVPGGSGNLLGVHGIDLANALFGSPRRVTAGLQRNVSRLPFEDTTAFTIEYDRAIAVITTSYVSQPLETACLMGTRGNLIARDGKIFLEANRKSTEISDLPAESAMDCLLREFVAAVREHRQPETGGEVGMAAVAVLEAALKTRRIEMNQRRQDWVEAAERLLHPALRSPVWPGPVSGGTPFAMRLEALMRPLWIAGPLMTDGKHDELAAWYREQIAQGVNPSHPQHWQLPVRKMDQAIVESAALAFNLVLARRQLWDTLTASAQRNVDNWLRACTASFNYSINNWNLFVVLIELARKQLGLKHSAATVASLLAEVEKMYQGDGWYADGFYRQFDYYVPWAIYTYLLIAAKWGGIEQQKIFERAARFAEDYRQYFDEEGRHIPYGRSLTYRFAASAFWVTCAWAGVPGVDLGMCRELAGRNISFFLKQPIFDGEGRVTTGFADPNERVNEPYISYASPYWCGKAFLPLALPAEHSFCNLPAKDLKTAAQKLFSKPNLIVTRSADGRNATLYNGGSHHPFDFGNHAAKYGKFAYSSHFGFNLADAALPSFDNMISLSPDGTTWSHRIRFEICPNQGNWLVSRHQPFAWWSKTVITTALGVFGSWHVRIHLLELEREFLVREGGTPTPASARSFARSAACTGVGNTEAAVFGVCRAMSSPAIAVRRSMSICCIAQFGCHCWRNGFRREFIVGSALVMQTPAGGTVEDVMKSMPSVNIDEVQLNPSVDRPLNIITGGGREWSL